MALKFWTVVMLYNILYGIFKIYPARILLKMIPAMILYRHDPKLELLFYLIGDFFLLLDDSLPHALPFGIASFAAGHLISTPKPLAALPVVPFAMMYTWHIREYLQDKIYPVMIYAIILAMKGSIPFMLSDLLLTLQIFVKPDWYGTGFHSLALTLYWMAIYF
jgi:hypothetical protein